MWLSRKSINNNKYGVLRSLQHKSCRRGDTYLAVQSTLELCKSMKKPGPALKYLKTILVEDKFPQGQYLINDILSVEDDCMDHSKICEYAKMVAQIPSDHHVAWLCKCALYYATNDSQCAIPEVVKATKIERILLKICRPKELPTPKDIPVEEGFSRILFELGNLNATEMVLWDRFKFGWRREPTKLTCRLYLYTIVANRFHQTQPDVQQTHTKLTPEEMTLDEYEVPDYALDKHTGAGRKRKRGVEHFLNIGVHSKNPPKDIDTRKNIAELAKEIYREEEVNFGTSNSKSKNGRARARKAMMEFTHFKGKQVLSMKQTQKPCGGKPCSWVVTTIDDKYFVKGPFKSPEKYNYQIEIDKCKVDIKKMNIEWYTPDDKLWYYCAPCFEGENINPGKFYSDKVLWEVIRVLIFRYGHNISDTNLRNIMVNKKGEVLSVDEMSGNRSQPKKVTSIMDYLFSPGKIPRKMFRNQLLKVIKDRKIEFITEMFIYASVTKPEIKRLVDQL